MNEHFNCPACGSADTVSYWDVHDKKPAEERAMASLTFCLRVLYPDARTCVDCGWTQPTKPRPRLDLKNLTVVKRDWRPTDD